MKDRVLATGSAPNWRARQGFTIVETMIVLAVTGVLFVVIAATLAGKQNAAEFTRAIQTVQADLQQTIDEVGQGFYPGLNTFHCAASGSTVQISAGSDTQGTNQDCVFLGKVVQFGVRGTDPEQYQIYTVAGLRSAVAGANSPFSLADPTIVGVGGDYTDYSTAHFLRYGLQTLWVHAGANSIGAVAFLMEPGSLNASSASGYSSGTLPVDLVPLRTTSVQQTIAQAVTASEDTATGGGGLPDPILTTSAPINPSSGVQICFVSGGTNQSGLVTIGNNGRTLAVTVNIKSNRTCS